MHPLIEDVRLWQYGLDKPICTINLKMADNSYEILVGLQSWIHSATSPL